LLPKKLLGDVMEDKKYHPFTIFQALAIAAFLLSKSTSPSITLIAASTSELLKLTLFQLAPVSYK
jgi:hypothetical protein